MRNLNQDTITQAVIARFAQTPEPRLKEVVTNLVQHLHFMIKANGYETLTTHVFRKGDPYLESDAVFGVRQSLVADWVQQPDGLFSLDFDFVLNPLHHDLHLSLAR